MNRKGNPLANWLFARRRCRFKGRVFTSEAGLRGVAKRIRAGEILYYLPDEDLGAEQKHVFAPFLGVPAATSTATPRLTRLCDALVLPVMSFYDASSGCYDVRIHPPMTDYPSGDDLADATRLNDALATLIRHDAGQYMWYLERFRTRPGGQPSPYDG